ncbi:MAG: polyphosphate kinase, partial [Synergistales bacterium]|nr:polyphosphate kinase [Synergistales bacterium]
GDFRREIFPILTPQAVDPGRPFPLISNLSVNLLVVLDDSAVGKRYVRLKIPRVISRLLPIPFGRGEASPALAERGRARGDFVWLEDIVAANLQSLFPGHRIEGAYPFRVTRNADMELQEDEGSDLLTAVQVGLEQRRFGPSVRLEVTPAMPEAELQFLLSRLELTPFQIYRAPDHLDLASLSRLARLERPDLKDEPFLPLPARSLCGDDPFGAVAEGDILLYHPYDSFVPVVDLIRRAAKDPDVLAIKMTLYRVGPGSPLVEALMEARTMGKQVTALVELKARFDEEHNISWARALEQAGVHVVYGLVGLKTHAKMCLIIRREEEGLRSYVHLGTGNYNHITAQLYEDIGMFTCDETLAEDAGVTIQSLHAFTAYETTLAFDNGQIFRADVMAYETINDYGKLHSVLLLTEATYAALTGEHLALEANEIALFTTAREPITALEMEGDHYALRRLDTLPVIPCMSSGTSMNKTYMIVPEEATAQRILLLTESSPENRLPRYTVQWNISGA